MSCLYWNVQGLGNPRAFKKLQRIIKLKDPTLVFLYETKISSYSCSSFKFLFHCDGLFVVDSIGANGGLIML